MLPSRDGLISTIVIALKDIVSVNITKTEEPEIVISVGKTSFQNICMTELQIWLMGWTQ